MALRKWIARTLIIELLLALSFLAFWPRLQSPITGDFAPNSCLIAAYTFEETVRAQTMLTPFAWSKLVKVTFCSWFRMPAGHCYCVFELRNGDIWVYDILEGSQSLSVPKRCHDIKAIAKALHTLHPTIHYVSFID